MPQGAGEGLFGTDGIRGLAGEFPLDEGTVELIGQSLTRNLSAELGRAPRILIGRDTRESGPSIETALARGAARAGAEIESAGVITTPGVAYITRSTPFDAGIVVSASHNPYRDNGIKVFSPSGKKLSDEMERRVEIDVAEGRGFSQRLASREVTELPRDYGYAASRHIESYVNYLVSDVASGLDLRGLRLAMDCANGAAAEIAPRVFRRLGAAVEAISVAPNGVNINDGCGSLHLDGLQTLVVGQGLDLGIGFDGDADRALFVDSSGRMIDGDFVMLALAKDMKSRGRLRGDVVVATVMSNLGLELALRDHGIEMVRARVGDRYVLEELLGRGASLGGEQSGHIILPDLSLAGDGIITAIELVRAMRASGGSLADLGLEMRSFPQVLVNVPVRSKPVLEAIPEVKAEIDRVQTEMEGRGRLLIRYSGTENLARVMIEGESKARISELADRLAKVIQAAVG